MTPARENTSQARKRSRLNSTARWIPVLPAVLLAPLGMWLLLILSAVGGIDITRGNIDLAACLDWQEQEKAEEPEVKDGN